MSDGRIKESQVTSSSVAKTWHGYVGRGPQFARLQSPSFWAPASGPPRQDRRQYVQVHFREAVDIKMVIRIMTHSLDMLSALHVSAIKGETYNPGPASSKPY